MIFNGKGAAKLNIRRIAASVIGSLLILFNCISLTAFAETPLPEGAVKGLPERLAALDDEGNAVNSDTGEYFFRVENMRYGETYSKDIQLMNLREDKSYNIFFSVEPLFKDGEIDLEKGCECRFYLDGTEVYKGDVNGKGNIDLSETPLDCGFYAPGDSHTLRCEVIWNDLDVLKDVDNGWRLIDKDGEHVLVAGEDNAYVEGEIEFKWIFYAQVTDDGTRSDSRSLSETEGSPYTGMIFKSGTFWLACIGVICVMIAVLLVLIARDRKKDKKK